MSFAWCDCNQRDCRLVHTDGVLVADAFSFADYEKHIVATRTMTGDDLVYPALGISGEAGEVTDKVKKLWRNRNVTHGADLTPEEKDALVKELGDVLWYTSALAMALGSSLEEVAQSNVVKLQDRQRRGVVKSEGDNR